MTAAATLAGLDGELAARLPVAILSVAFLGFFYCVLRREFGPDAAACASAILATSAGWLGLSHVAVTDLPLAVFLSAALLLALDWIRAGDARRLPWVSALLGLAILSKGFIPVVFALPLLWAGRGRLRALLSPRVWLPCLAVAGPWYAACYARNGWPFIQNLIVEHHLGRFTSPALQHSQPFWFYFPVILAALFPWTPSLLQAFRRESRRDRRLQFLALWPLWGLLFLSVALNKLPGYVMPLLPPLAALAGIGLARARSVRLVLLASALLLCAVPALASVLPEALASGLSRTAWPRIQWIWLWPLPAAAVALALEARAGRVATVAAVAAMVVAEVAWLKPAAFPQIDAAVSARPLWRSIAARAGRVCVESMHRSWRYGLNYYSVTPLPDCDTESREMRITQEDSAPPRVN
jgi:4-amino-4-deoxy-L-arabinose transferase-like glycosyltransferase